MKLVSFSQQGATRLGAVHGGKIIDLAGAAHRFAASIDLALAEPAIRAGPRSSKVLIAHWRSKHSFDDDLFGSAFDEDSSANTSSWLDDFTIKISQQFSGQVNNHGVEIAPGLSFPREADLETNRLGANIRYQNAFAPGWLLQASAQIRIYLNDDYQYRAEGDSIDIESRGNELFLQRSFDQHSIKLGRQTVVWGETSGNSVLDVINTTEFLHRH